MLLAGLLLHTADARLVSLAAVAVVVAVVAVVVVGEIISWRALDGRRRGGIIVGANLEVHA